jgi:hypothetical protein
MDSITGLTERTYPMPPASAVDVIGPIAQIPQQKQSNWCWAAVITGIVASKPNPPTPSYTDQCELAFATYRYSRVPPSHADCCENNDGDACNAPLSPPRIAGLGAPSPLTIASIAVQPPSRTDSTVKDESLVGALRARRPICIVINWKDFGQFHFVAIVGTAKVANVQQYLVADPIDGSGNWLDRTGLNAYHSHAGTDGTWGDTYVTI